MKVVMDNNSTITTISCLAIAALMAVIMYGCRSYTDIQKEALKAGLVQEPDHSQTTHWAKPQGK